MTEVYSKQVTRKVPEAVYNGGKRTRGVRYIVIHHNATTNNQNALNTWKVGSGSYTSAHYQVTPEDVYGVLGENYIAYHSGGTGGNDVPKIADINNLSIGIEHLNSTGAPSWLVSDKTLERSAKLVADICKRYNLPIDRSTIKRHGEITATQCCGGLDVDKLIAMVRKVSGQPTAPSNSAMQQFKDANGAFTATKKFRVDAIKKVNGIWQAMNYGLAGDKNDWISYGIPLDIMDNVTRGNSAPTQVGDSVKFMKAWNNGTIDKYGKKYIGIVYGKYGMIWFNPDNFIKL